MEATQTYTAFAEGARFAAGTLTDVVLAIKRHIGRADHADIRIFSDATGRSLDFNFQGTEREVRRRLEVFAPGKAAAEPDAPGPGRPRLGVVSREISLLPRQWEWLAAQDGGASAALRRLVDEARRKLGDGPTPKQAQERAYAFLAEAAGNLPGFEEALRCLYRKDRKGFLRHAEPWPGDVREHGLRLAAPAFAAGAK